MVEAAVSSKVVLQKRLGGAWGGGGGDVSGTIALKGKADIIYIPLFQREQQSVQLKSRI